MYIDRDGGILYVLMEYCSGAVTTVAFLRDLSFYERLTLTCANRGGVDGIKWRGAYFSFGDYRQLGLIKPFSFCRSSISTSILFTP